MEAAFFKLREGINSFVSTCVSNVTVIIYMDAVLEDPIEVTAGEGENKLIITIDKDAKVSYNWTRKTWGKIFRDGLNNVKSIVQDIIGFISSHAGTLLSLTMPGPPAIKQ